MKNSDVKIKRKVQLRRKIEKLNSSDKTHVVGSIPQSNSKTRKSKIWFWLFIGGIALFVIVGYLVFSKSDNSDRMPKGEENILPPFVVNDSTEVVPEEFEYSSEPELVEDNHVNVKDSVTSVESSSTTTVETPNNSSANVSNDINIEAMKVIRGDYGNGQERKDKLQDKYQTIQNLVNELKQEGVF